VQTALLLLTCVMGVTWLHPAGLVTEDTLLEVKEKCASEDWAQALVASRKNALAPWIDAPFERLQAVFPKKRGNVYHNFSCPADRHRLTFDPFNPGPFVCPICGRSYAADTDPGIYTPEDWYHGTMYDGWACMFYQAAADVAADLGLLGQIEDNDTYLRRGMAILLLYADAIEGIATDLNENRQFSRILTYHREGDNKVLFDLARAYELLRDAMSDAERTRFENVALRRLLDDIMIEPIYTYDHNNVYQWHRTIIQTALALEREDLIDWSFGYGEFDSEHQPEHRSIRRIAATHFKPDGAYWELCSGYHLYPLHHFCELAVISRNLARMDAERFPAERYDITDAGSPVGRVIHAALEWFMSLAMPDRSMTVLGDSTVSRAGMDDYFTTAEVGYRFFDVKAVGDYAGLREGKRSWAALLYGAPRIVQHELPFSSSYLSSGWVSLRNEWQGNRVWAGLNALIPGGGHQHADRLTLVTYACGKLLALEKGTPYNESVTRKLGTLSQAHNTVVVNRESQKQGEALSEEETPGIRFFFAGSDVKYAEAHGDRLHVDAKVYRRSVALMEDILLDCFRVEGGGTHDWIVNHAGPAPTLDIEMAEALFEPAEWLYNGSERVLGASTDGMWHAQWVVDEVTSRLTMLAASDTHVYALETYPIDNAVITEKDPPCQTLCVRRENDAPFVAVWDAWREAPNLESVEPGDSEGALCIKTRAATHYVLFGAGEAHFPDGLSLSSDAAFCTLRRTGTDTAESSRTAVCPRFPSDALTFVAGTQVEVTAPEGTVRISADAAATIEARCRDEQVTIETAPDIQYDTYGGVDHDRERPEIHVTISGDLWPASGPTALSAQGRR